MAERSNTPSRLQHTSRRGPRNCTIAHAIRSLWTRSNTSKSKASHYIYSDFQPCDGLFVQGSGVYSRAFPYDLSSFFDRPLSVHPARGFHMAKVWLADQFGRPHGAAQGRGTKSAPWHQPRNSNCAKVFRVDRHGARNQRQS